MDVFYKIKWLSEAGVNIHLHCFTYGREPSEELGRYCSKVYYYKRKTGLLSNFSWLPYTVRSRQSEELRSRLLGDKWPVLFEVLHTCYLMNDPAFRNRALIYRHSNIEHAYYRGLAESERNVWRKLYLHIEAFKLKRFERTIRQASLILAVNRSDRDYFHRTYPAVHSEYLPSFHPGLFLDISQPAGDYILFHGNLSISENYEAAEWLISKVFGGIRYKVIVAGMNPPGELKRLIRAHAHISLIENPDETEMDALITGARLHVLYTSQGTGLKLKLLNVLHRGRFLLCNPAMLEGTGLQADTGLKLASRPEEFMARIQELFNLVYDAQHLEQRKQTLAAFNNAHNAARLIELVSSVKPIPA